MLNLNSEQNAGAIAVLFVDGSDECTYFNELCGPGASRDRDERWGSEDVSSSWSSVRIPSFIIQRTNAGNNKEMALGKCLGFVTYTPEREAPQDEL